MKMLRSPGRSTVEMAGAWKGFTVKAKQDSRAQRAVGSLGQTGPGRWRSLSVLGESPRHGAHPEAQQQQKDDRV